MAEPRSSTSPSARDRQTRRAIVSFQSPLLLLTLLALPVAVLLYRAHSRRAERAAAAFANPALLASVAPRRPGWRRHAPYGLYAIALAGLALALARPEITVAVPDERASIVLTTDVSGSMQSTDVPPSRLVAAREAGLEFLDGVPREVRVGAVIFNHAVQTTEPPATDRAERPGRELPGYASAMTRRAPGSGTDSPR